MLKSKVTGAADGKVEGEHEVEYDEEKEYEGEVRAHLVSLIQVAPELDKAHADANADSNLEIGSMYESQRVSPCTLGRKVPTSPFKRQLKTARYHCKSKNTRHNLRRGEYSNRAKAEQKLHRIVAKPLKIWGPAPELREAYLDVIKRRKVVEAHDAD